MAGRREGRRDPDGGQHGSAPGAARITGLVGGCESEILASISGGGGVLAYLRAQRDAHAESLRRGVRMRLLFGTQVLAVPELLDELRQRSRAGASIRFSGHVSRGIAVFDQRTAAFATQGYSFVPSTADLITDEPIVAVLHEHLSLLWLHAVSIDLSPDAAVNVDGDDEVVRTLRAGLTDEVAARTLGLSVRTYRRRVGSLMRRLGARSRFEAGFLANGPRRDR
ncbi:MULTISPECIES: helix-turn-helix transcriptional regulator [unclassified Pseudonocardia]|uniref:helix-turn-helix transcriptional regulator n=1 Tax=unclassified Pseudonocardia TaxID=2619320 RepID=UPI0011AE7B83|nr:MULTISPECIES: hypothetical protein [unclassified Pseudonocardia]